MPYTITGPAMVNIFAPAYSLANGEVVKSQEVTAEADFVPKKTSGTVPLSTGPNKQKDTGNYSVSFLMRFNLYSYRNIPEPEQSVYPCLLIRLSNHKVIQSSLSAVVVLFPVMPCYPPVIHLFLGYSWRLPLSTLLR